MCIRDSLRALTKIGVYMEWMGASSATDLDLLVKIHRLFEAEVILITEDIGAVLWVPTDDHNILCLDSRGRKTSVNLSKLKLIGVVRNKPFDGPNIRLQLINPVENCRR
eukprot:TRINITY_DN9816_c0_g1_i1.p3 TRINITY_DN9816_c0_g1~~TRINITY_DN9816_c0_g1_i1.p3  ORF type:complete len:109 (-),score=19.02 TRINITY_DN9816_c0_g1_i1:843-1169(-)